MASCLVLRLAAPLQSWGTSSEFNRRTTGAAPSKSGIIGLLAAAEGRRRTEPIVDLVRLRFGVRVDQAGSLLRDYHTVSDYRGKPLPSATLAGSGKQRPTAPNKFTAVTNRYYLQDAVFVAVLEGDPTLLRNLGDAVRRPGFPLALGRRSCVPTQPLLLLPDGDGPLWAGDADTVLADVAWQGKPTPRSRATVELPVSVDDPEGEDVVADVPRSFAPTERGFVTRRVRHGWVTVPTGTESEASAHDPFALLGW
ncbi:type I-E CRISPR-associated protein Cas5/CasD [Nitriliruptoraceae bacterium ZYF776]|nr:type I-E CRISPR-associated protein Cas5/CasD [Profundirhabdus halotolerans]